jgi:hypothetical protein
MLSDHSSPETMTMSIQVESPSLDRSVAQTRRMGVGYRLVFYLVLFIVVNLIANLARVTRREWCGRSLC